MAKSMRRQQFQSSRKMLQAQRNAERSQRFAQSKLPERDPPPAAQNAPIPAVPQETQPIPLYLPPAPKRGLFSKLFGKRS